jgi:hypothetical protein
LGRARGVPGVIPAATRSSCCRRSCTAGPRDVC